jgi:hypothetical protein
METGKITDEILTEAKAIEIIKRYGGVELTEKESNSPEYIGLFEKPSCAYESDDEFRKYVMGC